MTSAYDKLRESLYSDSFALEVLPRRRLFVSGSVLSVISATVDVSALMPISPTITFNGPADGLLFEWGQLNFAPASTSTVTCTDAGLTVNVLPPTGFRSIVFGLRRSREPGGVSTLGALAVGEPFDLSPGLFGALDLAGTTGKNTPATSISNITLNATFAEAGSAAQNILWQATLFVRQVRGLQEN